MPEFREKPVVIEAMQWDGSMESIHAICDWSLSYTTEDGEPWVDYVTAGETPQDVQVITLEGHMSVSVGDWIIKGIQDEFYPCKPGIFEATYEPVD